MKLSSRIDLKNTVLVLVLCALLWIGFGPIQLGGPVSYIIITGNSMEPDIEYGDLVIARQKGHYQLDQRVIYQHPHLGFVFHRIVDQVQDRFILQGDNNSWLDSYQPTSQDILGSYWTHIPGAGKIVSTLREPLFFSAFIIIAFSFVGGLVLLPDQDSKKERRRKPKHMRNQNPPRTAGDLRMEILFILGLVAAAALIFGLIAYFKDPLMIVNDDLFYQQKAKLAYSASSAGGIYDRDGVETGDPVYPALACNLDLDFDYQFQSPRLAAADLDRFKGTISLWAEIRDNDGWNRTFLLVPDYQFSSSGIQAQPSINICRTLDLIAEKELKTGLAVKAYTFSILPRIDISGELAGIEFVEEFQPVFEFELNQSVLRVPPNSTGFYVEQEGEILHELEVPNLLNLFGKQVPVLTIRKIALIILGVSLIAAIYPAWTLIRDYQTSAHTRIELGNRPMMIDLKASKLNDEDYTVIELETMEDLRKLADRYGAMIFHESQGQQHRYLVIDDELIYTYTLEDQAQTAGSGEQDEDLG